MSESSWTATDAGLRGGSWVAAQDAPHRRRSGAPGGARCARARPPRAHAVRVLGAELGAAARRGVAPHDAAGDLPARRGLPEGSDGTRNPPRHRWRRDAPATSRCATCSPLPKRSTAANGELLLCLALSYGGREAIVEAASASAWRARPRAAPAARRSTRPCILARALDGARYCRLSI